MNKNRLETLLRPPHKPASNPVGFTRRAQSKSRTNPYFGRSHKITKSELFARRLQPGDSGFHGLSTHSVPLKLSDIKNTGLNRTRTKVVFYSDELGRTWGRVTPGGMAMRKPSSYCTGSRNTLARGFGCNIARVGRGSRKIAEQVPLLGQGLGITID